MQLIKPQSMVQIIETAARRPFSGKDLGLMQSHFEANVWGQGFDIVIDESIAELSEMFSEGFLCIQSRTIECDILLLNVDAGRGFFGGEKRKVLTYTSDLFKNEYFAGPVLGSLLRALAGINNLYRTGSKTF